MRTGSGTDQTTERMIGGGTPDETVHASQHSQENRGGRRKGNDRERRCAFAYAVSASAVEQFP